MPLSLRPFLGMDDIKIKILTGALRLYAHYGIKSLTMDDVARELGISKKTLYQYVTDKEDLVNQAFSMHLENAERRCRNIFKEVHNPIEEMLVICGWQCENVGKINPAAFFDLKKYHPGSFNEFKEFKQRVILPTIKSNLSRGMQEEIYRSDLDIDAVVQIYLHLIDFTANPEITGFSNIAKVINEIIQYHLNSITTIKGRKLLAKELEKIHIHKS
jgi:AcrR family transcriptional regulator